MPKAVDTRPGARSRKAMVIVPMAAATGFLGAGILTAAPAGASSVTKNNTFTYTDDSNHQVTCKIAQTIDRSHNNDHQLTLGTTTLSLVSGGLAGDCTTFTSSFCQQASWTDPFGNSGGSANDCRPTGNSSPLNVEYAPVGSNFTLYSSVHFTHCVPGSGNSCDASFSFTK
jgi:hypothetical protein